MKPLYLASVMLLASLTSCSGSDNPLLGDWTVRYPTRGAQHAFEGILSFKDDGTAVLSSVDAKDTPEALTWKAVSDAKPMDGYKAVLSVTENNRPPQQCSYAVSGVLLRLAPGCIGPANRPVWLVRKDTPTDDPAYLVGSWAAGFRKEPGEIWDGQLQMNMDGTVTLRGIADYSKEVGPFAGTWKAETGTKPPEGYDGTLTIAVTNALSFTCPYKTDRATIQMAPGCGPTFYRAP